MKRFALMITLITVCVLLLGCIMVIPGSDSIGESKIFSKDGISLLLTDRFQEQESELGFDAYYVSDFCGVMVMKEEFTLEAGLEQLPLSEYIQNVIENNGHKDVEPQSKDGLWYYVKETGNSRVYAYCYKGTDAFWIVQFACHRANAEMLEDTIYLFAQAVEVD